MRMCAVSHAPTALRPGQFSHDTIPMQTDVCKCMDQLHSMHVITGRRHLRLGYCLPCTAMAVTAESKRFFVMGQPVASTTASLAVTCTHTRTLQPSYDRLARLPPWSTAVHSYGCDSRLKEVLSNGAAYGKHHSVFGCHLYTYMHASSLMQETGGLAPLSMLCTAMAVRVESKRFLAMGQPVASTTASLAITCTHTRTLQLSRPTLPDLFLLYVCESKCQGSCIRCSFGHMARSRTRFCTQQILHACTCMVLLVSICKLHESQTNPSN